MSYPSGDCQRLKFSSADAYVVRVINAYTIIIIIITIIIIIIITIISRHREQIVSSVSGAARGFSSIGALVISLSYIVRHACCRLGHLSVIVY